MKIKEGFVLRKVGVQYVVVPIGGEVVDFNGMIHLNESGKLLWELLQEELTLSDLVKKVMDCYEVTEEQCTKDVETFIGKINKAGLLE